MQKNPNSVNKILSDIRGFFNFLIRQGLYTHNPSARYSAPSGEVFYSFCFSPEETDQLLKSISKRIRNTEEHFLTDVALYLTVLLLARCGMRIMEPLRLRLTQYRSGRRNHLHRENKVQKRPVDPAPRIRDNGNRKLPFRAKIIVAS
jgi:integrase/recombinase XerD